MKTLNASHVTEIAAKVKEIGELKDQIKGLKESTLIKTGAALSAATCSTLKKAIDGISGHVATLKSLVDPVNTQDVDGDPDDGDTKDYTDEEIQKMVSDNVNKKIEEATK
jgi:hypothetical protein